MLNLSAQPVRIIRTFDDAAPANAGRSENY
jgi:hypothetical protein